MKRSITTRQEMDQVQAKRDEHDLMLKALKMVGFWSCTGIKKLKLELGISDQDMIELRPLMLKAISTAWLPGLLIATDMENTYGFFA